MKVRKIVYGKVLLSGEHAVVYGEPAIASQINRGVSVQVEDGVNGLDLISPIKHNQELIEKAVELGGGKGLNLKLTIESDLPIGSGLGSSAAVAAAVIKATSTYFHKTLKNDELFNLTMECEKLSHGNPSGVDPAAVIYGGLIRFVKNKPIQHFKIPNSIELYLIQTGKPVETTKEMVEMVADKVRLKNKYRKLISDIGRVTVGMKEALINGQDISALINENGILLEELGVVGIKAIELSQEIREIGGSVKVSGAGGVREGSGMLLVYHTDASVIQRFLDQKKLDYFKVIIGG